MAYKKEKDMSQKLKFHFIDQGDPEAGISSSREEITVTLKFGGHDEETLAVLTELMREAIYKSLWITRAKVLTDGQMKRMKQSKRPSQV